MFRSHRFENHCRFWACDRMQISKGPTSSSLFLLTVMLHLASSRWTYLMKKLKYGRNCPKRNSKLETEVDPNFSVRIINKHDWRFVHSCKVDITYHILAKRASGLYTVWDVVTCCLGWIICHSFTQATSFRPPMRMTAYASGVRTPHRRRQTRGLQVLTLRRLPMSDFAKRKFSELSKDPGSASRLNEPQFSELKTKVSDHHGSFFALSARGDFGGEPMGSTPKSVFPMLARPSGSCTFGSSSQSLHPLAPSLSSCLLYPIYGYGRVYLHYCRSCRPACRCAATRARL